MGLGETLGLMPGKSGLGDGTDRDRLRLPREAVAPVMVQSEVSR